MQYLKRVFITKTIKDQYKVSFKYPLMNDVMRLIKEHNLEDYKY